jgi:hypothetical protein
MPTSDKLTLATMAGLMAGIPKAPLWRACTATPEHVARLRAECQANSPSPLQADDLVAGIKLFAKPGQVASAWMFSDDKILRKYLDDELTELDLFGLMSSHTCQPG